MKDGKGGHCCLNVAQECGINLGSKSQKASIKDIIPTTQTKRFFGWDESNALLVVPNGHNKIQAALLNDGSSLGHLPTPHKIIAECVMNTFVHPKKQRWSKRALKFFEKQWL